MRRAMPKLLLNGLLILGLSLMTAACGEESDDEEDEDTAGQGVGTGSGQPGSGNSQTVIMPQVGSISLTGLGTGTSSAALRLQDDSSGDDSGCDQEGLGIMGFALGGACHTTGLASGLLLGKEDGDHDGDGDMDCDDFTAAEAAGTSAGLLMHLICGDVFQQFDNLTSMAFADEENPDNDNIAISFADATGGVEAVGSWTQGNTASYPADIRFWGGSDIAALNGVFFLALEDVNNGRISIPSFGADADDESGLGFQVDFSTKTDTTTCATAPSDENCHVQEVKVYAGEGAVTDGPPNGFHIKVLADDKETPEFIIVEGRYRYTQALAEAAFNESDNDACPISVFRSMRSVYFRVIQGAEQLWGQFVFRDENGDTLDCGFPAPINFNPFTTLAADEGVCQNLGSEEWVDCDADYPALFDGWLGEENTDLVTENPVADLDFTGAPTEQGICTTETCITIPAE